MKKIEVLGLQTVPQIRQGTYLAQIIVGCAVDEIGGLRDKDVVVITSKIVSKAAGRTRKLSEVRAGKKALALSARTGKDARWLQMIFDEGHEILAIIPIRGAVREHIMRASAGDDDSVEQLCRHEQAVCVTRGPHGRIHTCDAGIDGSNHPTDVVSLLPEDPDLAAAQLRQQIRELTGTRVAVILADTEIVPFGTIDLAVGSAGIAPRARNFGAKDMFGKPKFGGIDLVAHELTAAAALVFGQTTAAIPVAIIRGRDYEVSETENISNTLVPEPGDNTIGDVVRWSLRATSHVSRLRGRLLLRIASRLF